MTVVTLPLYVRPAVSIPPYPYYAAHTFLSATQYDTATEVIALSDGQMASNVTGDLLSLDLTDPTKYGYLFSPVSNGTILFTDNSNNIPGGWDGASWAQDDIGSEYGPIIVSLDFGAGATDWYVYRTDFPGVGNKTWRLTYAR